MKSLYIKWKHSSLNKISSPAHLGVEGQGTQWRYHSHYFSGHFLIISFDDGFGNLPSLKIAIPTDEIVRVVERNG